ncbi:MAG: hypothetical protein IID32_04395 [Planctomycetes bacterium]|nr:hypothetical protein [Planctomycetota bacterium]
MFARKILLYINLALVGLLAALLVQTLLPRQDGDAPLAPKSAAGNPIATNIPSPQASDEAISTPQSSTHLISDTLFNHAAQSTPAPGQNPLTNHPFKHLVLTMTVAGNDTVARATIKNTKTNSTQLYKTNDLLDSARIAKITRGQVLLQHGQNQYTLNLVRQSNSSPAPSSPENLPRQLTRCHVELNDEMGICIP